MRNRAHAVTLVLLPCFVFVGFSHSAPQSASSANEPQPKVALGVLEDVPDPYGGPNVRAVRAIFQNVGGRWLPFRNACQDEACLKAITSEYPAEVTWTITFDGKNLGEVTARTPNDFKFYSDIGLQKITSRDPVPTIGKRSEEYSGFLFAPVYRPLVAVSRPYFKDPESWKPARLTTELVATLRRQFRERFPEVSNCENPNENGLRRWQYLDDDIKIGKSYSSKNNWSLAELSLEGWACDGPTEDGGPFESQWFVVEPTGETRFLGADMWLVDAGDYDGDGKSEILFSVSAYDRGGYRLFYDDFKKSVEFLFVYH